MMKIATIIGARPQFIKAATVSRCIRKDTNIQEIIIHTGQHYDANMSDIFFNELNIPKPDYNLRIQEKLHGAMTGKMLAGIEDIILKEKFDLVLVYGDTNSTLAGALAAIKLHIPVAHVEAGLRSFNRRMPEEINRLITDHVSELLFTPTETAHQNLVCEGIRGNKVHLVGDVMYDATLFYLKQSKCPIIMNKLGLTKPASYILATIHRAENIDVSSRLKSIMQGLSDSSLSTPVILPVHPRTKAKLDHLNINISSNVHLIDPVGFLEMVWLEKNAMLIATDSGGVQKEAYFHGIPCVTFREETEWVELIEAGWNRLVSFSVDNIYETIIDAIGSTGKKVNLYGAGNAAQKIVRVLNEFSF